MTHAYINKVKVHKISVKVFFRFIMALSISTFVCGYSFSAEIKPCYREYKYVVSDFRLKMLGLVESANPTSQIANPVLRTSDVFHAGDYLRKPWGEETVADSNVIVFIKSLVKKFLSPKYYDDNIFKYVRVFTDTLTLKREEFYFGFLSNGIHMIISGWTGEFAHVIVFTDFNSKNSLLEKANDFFTLPSIEKSEVDYNEYRYYDGEPDYFYSYTETKGNFKLTGYPVIYWEGTIEGGKVKRQISVIDLTIYPKKVEEK